MRRSRAWLFALPVLGGLLVLLTGKRRTDSAGGVVTRPDTSTPAAPILGRAAVVAAAVSQLGNDDPKLYWDDVLPGKDPSGADWCGAFALWCLHQAGLALDWMWEIESGFALSDKHQSLPVTKSPLPGDMAYFDHNQHMAVVELVTPTAVQLVNGNGTAGAVTRSTALRSSVSAFFSIAPLLAEKGLPNS
jgi:hypothetical protein